MRSGFVEFPCNHGAQRGQVGPREEFVVFEFAVEMRANCDQHLDDEHRVAAEREKIVFETDVRHAQQLLPKVLEVGRHRSGAGINFRRGGLI